MTTRVTPASGVDEGGSRERNTRRRYPGFADYLSPEEKRALGALGELGRDPRRRAVPTPLALRLLSLGLAELSCGRLVLTGTGRDALTLVQQPLGEPSRGSER